MHGSEVLECHARNAVRRAGVCVSAVLFQSSAQLVERPDVDGDENNKENYGHLISSKAREIRVALYLLMRRTWEYVQGCTTDGALLYFRHILSARI